MSSETKVLSVNEELQQIRKKYAEHKQEHIFQFVDKLNDEQKKQLLKDLKSIDLEHLLSNFAAVGKWEEDRKKDVITPFDRTTVLEATSAQQIQSWNDFGLQLIAESKVAVILLAGGQGTRLGSAKPKGCFDIGLPSHKSLFQLQAERIIRLKQLASKHKKIDESKVHLPWYILTSFQTDFETRKFFSEHKFFGLEEADVIFFEQGNLPCLTKDGTIILETGSKIAQAPNGNGGVYLALKRSGVLADMKRRGIGYSHFFGVDNVMVKVADPIFVGFVASQGADCGNKVVLKVNPKEKVGVMCYRNGKPDVVEYSELPEESSSARGKDGTLLYNAGNICNHVFTTDFLEKVADANSLPFHVAFKKIPYANEEGKTVSPTSENGFKLEMFVFDSFSSAKNMICLAVPRTSEFSAVKNAEGKGVIDSPQTARYDMSAYHIKLVEQAGGTVIRSDDPEKLLELSPLVSYSGEHLHSVVHGKTFTLPVHIQ